MPLKVLPDASLADALRQTRQLYVAITFHADPATLTNEQLDALLRSDDLAAGSLPIKTTP